MIFGDNVTNIRGEIPISFVEKYIKDEKYGKIITPSGISVLIAEYTKMGRLQIECKSCSNHDKLKIQLDKIKYSQGDVTRGFIVKSKDPYHHLTAIYVQKRSDRISIFIADTQGGQSKYDFSTLKDLQELDMIDTENIEIFNLYEKREYEASREGAFAFHDLLMMAKYQDNLIIHLKEIASNREQLSVKYLPKVKFKPVYLKDLPSEFTKFTNIPVTESTKYVKDFGKGKIFNVLSHHHFDKYESIIMSRLKYEYYVKTTYDGNILTPRGLNVLIKLFQDDNTLLVAAIALETHEEFRQLLIEYINEESKNDIAFLVKSKDPHDHITPIFIRKIDNGLKVILMDTQGGMPGYDTSSLWDFIRLKIKNVEIYNVIGRRQYDNNTCPVFSLTDIMHLSQMDDAFSYFNNITKGRELISLPNVPIKFKPIYLSDLPENFMLLTTRYGTILDYANSLTEENKQIFLQLINEHLVEVEYKNKIITSNTWSEELNNQYSEVILSHII